MDRSELQDAFSKTLDTKPRHSYVNHIKQQLQEEEKSDKRLNGSTVNRLSRAFETNTFERPALPAKPPTLRPPSTQLQPKPPQPPKPPQTLNSQQIPKLQLNADTPEIDETQPTFKDLRAKFQQENSIPIQDLPHQNNYRPPIPLKPSKTGPISSPEKLIRAAKTGPPALPVKPKMNSHRYMDPLNHQLPPLRQYQTLAPLETHDAPQASSLNIPSSSINSIPSLLPHTATDNSSIHSTTSTSSQASTLNSSKRGWHLSSWFSSQQQRPQQHEQLKNSIRRPDSNNNSTGNQEEYDTSKPISPQLTAETNQTMSEKRTKVIQELLVTEKSYQKDMNLLKDIYYDGASKSDLFSKSDMRHLFSNLLNIVEFERTFVALLETSCEQDSVGSSFREMMHDIDSIYSEYCKRHEDAVLKLQELEVRPKIEAFLKECKEQIQGKTTSWDLGSLLIKPVQRVLKYPLLLREILSLTPSTHNEYDELLAAVKEIQEVADNINEIKRRKDIVEKIVGDKKRTDINVVHGINKKFSRRAQKLKQATGFAVEPTHDILFEALYSKFEEQQELIRQFARDVQGWVRHVKIMFENLQQLACSMESLYSSWGGARVKSLTGISDFSKMASHLSAKLSRELDNDIRGYIYSRIDDFLKVFDNPTQVIYKRSMKMIDYDRVRDMKIKGDVPDKALQESADAYVSINAQLVDELPKFFQLTKKFFDVLISEFALVQIKFYGMIRKEWMQLVEQKLGLQAASSLDEILAQHLQEMDKVEDIANKITILHRSRYAASSRSNSSNSSIKLKQRSKDAYSLRSANSDSDMTFGSYFIQTPISSQPVTTMEPENLISLDDYDTSMVPIPTSDDFDCIMLYDFETHEEDRLDVKRGTILRISQDRDFIDPDWWFATTVDDYRSGWVPINYCKKL